MDEKRVIETIKTIMPAVVSIIISKHMDDVEKDLPHEFYHFLPGHGEGTKKEPPKKKLVISDVLETDANGMISVGGGSGFIVHPKGIILTNRHVISEPKSSYTVVLSDNRKLPAQVLTVDPINDIAILKIETKEDLPFIRLGNAANLQLGQQVIAIGNALGIFRNTVSVGIVSGLSRSITARENPKSPAMELRGLIQTDAAINPGNSGGPLVNLDGLVIGINAAVISGASNISFAIPINAAHRDLQDLEKYGRIKRAFLGVRYLIIDEFLKNRMNLPVDYGAVIVKETPHDHGVLADSPAGRAGLQEKDIILAIDNKKINFEHTIQDALEDKHVGDLVEVYLLRNGTSLTKNVVLSERK